MTDQQSIDQNGLLKAALDSIDQGIVVYDENLIVVAFNQRALEILEMPENHFSVGEPFEKWIKYTAEQNGYGAKGTVEERIEKRLTIARLLQPYRSDQTRFDNKVIEVSGNPVPGIGYVTTYTDVTERKRTEEAFRESEERFRSLVEASPVCIHEIDLDGRLTSMNRAGLVMMGVSEESEVCGLRYLDVPIESDQARISELMVAAFRGESSIFEFAANGPNGLLYFQSCFAPIANEHGEVDRLMGITQDISQRKAAEFGRELALNDGPVPL